MPNTALVWLRNDLRVGDNPALEAALAEEQPVIALYVEETDPRLRPRGAASKWWLEQSLGALGKDLAAIGVRLETASGAVLDALSAHAPAAVYWNRRYGPAEREVDAEIKLALRERGIEVKSFPGNVLVEPFDIATKAGGPYGVFTPFWNALNTRDIKLPQRAGPSRKPLRAPKLDTGYRPAAWTGKLAGHWSIGERAATERLVAFLDRIEDYPEGRDYPARDATSRLSPHLAFGEISARQVWHAAQSLADREPSKAAAVEKFLMELAWRDFNHHQLYHRPDIATTPMQPRFAGLRWRRAESDLEAWRRGRTGIAIVDAGMREMWETGFMHNRVRMIVASLLTKNLLLNWRDGEAWFWDCLVDADLANNAGNWQWVAGCGTDAAPYFRIFNPDTQAEKFDPDGEYVRRWVSEPLSPIVDLKTSRERALAAFAALKEPAS